MIMRKKTINLCLWRNIDLVYASEFFKAAVNDEETIIKKTRNEVDCQIYSHSDTTITTVTSGLCRFL